MNNVLNVLDALNAVTIGDTNDTKLLIRIHKLAQYIEDSVGARGPQLHSHGLTFDEVDCLTCVPSKKFEAIKKVRIRLNMGLADGKRFVENHPDCL